ncbi:MAG TPA: hypothetical protein VF199_14995, partial [Bacillales bacterium]
MRLQRFLRYGYEGFAIYLALVPFYMRTDQLPPLTAFLLVYLLAGFIFFLFLRNQTSVSYVVPILVAPLLVALALVLGFPAFLAVGLAAVCCWRGFTLLFRLQDLSDTLNEVALFFLTLALALFLFIFFSFYEHEAVILVIVVLQFVYLLGMKLFTRLIEAGFGGQEQRKAYIRWGSGAVIGLVGVSALLLLIFPAVKWVLFSGFGLLVRGIGFILAYPVFWLLSKLISPEVAGQTVGGLVNLNPSDQKAELNQAAGHQGSALPMEGIFWGLVVCIFIAFLIVFFRKKAKLDDTQSDGQSNVS